MATLQTKFVFTPGGMPTVTYIDRNQLDLEGQLRRAIDRGYALISLTGPTKSGKTVLCRRVVPSDEALWLEAGQIRSEDEFWDQAAFRLNLADSVTKATTHERGSGANGEIGTEINIGIAKISAKTGGVGDERRSTASSATWLGNTKLQVLQDLKSDNKPLIVDDFHYLTSDLQQIIIQSLKAEIFNGLTVIFLSVPHRAFDPVTVEREMQGRFKQVIIPAWNEDDLQRIGTTGFDALNVAVGGDVITKFAKEAFESPLLMQSFCSSLMLTSGIRETQNQTTNVVADRSAINAIFSEVSGDFGFPLYDTLRRGPQSRTERNTRLISTGEECDIYEAVMYAIALTGPQSELHYDDIRTSLKQVLVDQTLQKHEVTRTLGHMSRIAKESLKGEPVIEWISDRDRLFITDPFLLFYLRWSVAAKFNNKT